MGLFILIVLGLIVIAGFAVFVVWWLVDRDDERHGRG